LEGGGGLGAVVLGVSPDSAASHQKFKKKYTLPFPLLADEDHAVAEAYGAWEKVHVRQEVQGDPADYLSDRREGSIAGVLRK
jgi:peroxiredoxin Q/BCP